jgi:acyl-CoA synthetase (AMP-forming)/AMP-acid ligase II
MSQELGAIPVAGSRSDPGRELVDWCRGDPSSIAIQTPVEQITFSMLKERVERVTSAIAGVLRQVTHPVVGVLLPAGASFITAFLGALETGAIVVPLEPVWPDERLQQLIDDARLSLLISDTRHGERLGQTSRGVPVRTLDEVFASPEGAAAIQAIDDPERGSLRLVADPIRVDGRVPPARKPPPRLGEHTDEVRSELEG